MNKEQLSQTEKPPFNTLAFASVFAAMVSGLFNPYGIVGGIAVICGICALPSIIQKRARGLVLSIIGIVFGLISIVLYFYVFYLTFGNFLH